MMVTEGKQKSWRPQFSLRMMLFVFLTVAAGISWYLSMLPVTFPVPVVMEFDELSGQRVSSVIEHQTSWVATSVRENAKRFVNKSKVQNYNYHNLENPTPAQLDARKELLLENLADLYLRDESDAKLVDKHRGEFIAAAKEQVKPNAYFQRAAGAAAVLDRFGDSKQLAAIIQRSFDDGSQERDILDLFAHFDHERLLCNQQIVSLLKLKAKDPNGHEWYRVQLAEKLDSIDPAILKSVHVSIVENLSPAGKRADSIEWLVENDATESSFQMAIEFLSVPEHWNPSYRCQRLLELMCESLEFENADKAMREEFVSLATEMAKQEITYFYVLAGHGKAEFEAFIRDSIASPKNGSELQSAIYGIRKFVPESEFKSLLRTAFEKSPYAKSIFKIHVDTFGLDETTQVLRSRWTSEKSHWLLGLICKHAKSEDEAELCKILEDSFESALRRASSLPGYFSNRKPLEVLYYLRKFGRIDLAKELATKLPAEDGWLFVHSEKPKQFVDWFNEYFELEDPLSVQDVIATDAEYLEGDYGASVSYTHLTLPTKA